MESDRREVEDAGSGGGVDWTISRNRIFASAPRACVNRQAGSTAARPGANVVTDLAWWIQGNRGGALATCFLNKAPLPVIESAILAQCWPDLISPSLAREGVVWRN